jgi:hypothetical protein
MILAQIISPIVFSITKFLVKNVFKTPLSSTIAPTSIRSQIDETSLALIKYYFKINKQVHEDKKISFIVIILF